MQYKGKFVKKNFNKLNKYIQQHLLHTYHLRPMINHISKKDWNDIIGVEIGTLHGLNALSMLQNLDIKHLYLVDPYIMYDDGINTYKNREKDFQKAKENLRQYKDKVTFIKKLSHDALQNIPHDVDFVYIDGNHSYCYVKRDIEDYYQKVRTGGIIGGHDFRADCAGLCRAVLEFATKKKLKLHGWITDWWFEKEL